jgi:hypothetical protein
MNWKQPIPTNLEEIFGEDYRCMALYRHLIYKSSNKDGFITINKKTIKILKGQVVFGRNQFAKELCWDDKTTDRALIKLEKVYNQLTNQRNNNYTIVTLLNYDEQTYMTNQMTNRRPTSDQPVTTSKSVKNVKNNIYSSSSFLLNIPSNDIEQISKDLGVNKEDITLKGKSLYDYCKSKGKQYKDYKAFLRNCLRKDKPQNQVNNLLKGTVNYADLK